MASRMVKRNFSEDEYMRGWLKRAHQDENAVVRRFWKRGFPALRLPVSGGHTLFKGDVFAFENGAVHLILVRRSENPKAEKIVFKEYEIKDVFAVASRIQSLIFPTRVIVSLIVHYLRIEIKGDRKIRHWTWKDIPLTDWKGGDVVVKLK